MTTAYLRTTLHVDEQGWSAARTAFSESADPIGQVDSKEGIPPDLTLFCEHSLY